MPWPHVREFLAILDALDPHLSYSIASDTIVPYREAYFHVSVAYDPIPNHDEMYTFHVLLQKRMNKQNSITAIRKKTEKKTRNRNENENEN